ncbi:putative 3-hydroxyphenylpropionic transporter MhpT [Pseudovibrio axinellae]|uniref:Putative 3-hydroxyphenylpropionic transporter MhpT n=1 Tax=Pseudovibrio axinellae TaxID=989403 RepID=A0A166ASI5_9HYPH|nr:MFS transporter [Pseudovibrio axinellae]KZL21496.1 putative 3-hydroxyphenylpropionic transporter MhpT [Pseudovibrio axinellae]SER07165.1 Predicted arabinose efflux permease, MFS family [Pseudovibrio axinellae]
MKQQGIVCEQPVWRDPRGIALLLAATLTVMANATISPALAGLEKMFMHEPNAALLTRLLVSAPSLTVVIFAPLSGLVADRYGRRNLLLAGVCLFIVAGSSGLFMPSLMSMLMGRLALGVAVAMVMTAQTALIGDYFTGHQRGALMGLQTSARNFGGLVFITAAGVMAVTSPRLPFAVYGLALLYLPFLWRYIVEPGLQKPKTENVTQVQSDGHPAWAWLIAALAVVQMLTNMMFFLMPTQLPFFLVARGFESASVTGAALGVLMLSGGTAALLYGRIKSQIGYGGAFVLGFGFMALGLFVLTVQEDYAVFLGGAAVGAGYALAMPNFSAIALLIAPAARRGMAGGVLTSSVFLGQFLSVFVSIPLIAAVGFEETFQIVSIALTMMAIVALSSRLWSGVFRMPKALAGS